MMRGLWRERDRIMGTTVCLVKGFVFNSFYLKMNETLCKHLLQSKLA